MTTRREWDLERICLSALERPAADRAAFLIEACGSDEELRREAESLIARDGAAVSFLEAPPLSGALSLMFAATVPTMAAGDRLGPYAVVSSLGSGGMGEVYRARDATLDREIAIKVLPSLFTTDRQRLERFEREARLLASLNHPNIATLHGIEHVGGIHALVLELVEGETLAERLRSTAGHPPTGAGLPLATVSSIARQIASALDSAHVKGIVHRDLKPANVMIRPDGVVKLVDFGVAKLVPLDRQDDMADPIRRPDSVTVEGMTLGTPAYMSPEQARGLQVDKRTDIWAFGCILFEMLAGRRPFEGNTVADTVARVLEHDPDWSALPRTTPAAVEKLVRRCLRKDPERRLRDVGDAVEDLEENHGTDGVVHSSRPATAGRFSRWGRFVPALLIVVSLGASRFWSPLSTVRPTEQRVVRVDVDLGPEVSLATRFAGPAIAISPDGERLVFVSNGRLMTQRLDHPVSVPLVGTDGVSTSDGLTFFFSPDSKKVGFIAEGKLKQLALDGGSVVTICDAPREGRGGTWGEDDSIVFAGTFGGLMRVRARGGPVEPVTRLDHAEITHRWPQLLPGGKAVLFTSHTSPAWFSQARVDVLSLTDGRRKRLLDGAAFGRFVADSEGTGYLTFVRSGTLFAAAFDPVRLELLSPPFPVFERVAYDSAGAAQMDASRTGTVIARRQTKFNVAWLESAGSSPLFAEHGDFVGPMLSHAGDRVAFTDVEDIWVYDIRRGIRSQVTKGLAASGSKVWTSDDQFIVFSTPGGIWYVQSDGGAEPRLLLPAEAPLVRVASAIMGARHNSRLAFHEFRPDGAGMWDQWTVPVAIDGTGLRAGKPEPFLQTRADERHLDFSADGRLVAYASSEAGGRHETFVRSFPDDGRLWKVSDGGGMTPLWSPGRPGLFFQAGELLMVAPYAVDGAVFSAGKPHVWSQQNLALQRTGPAYAVSRDGTRVVAIVPDRTSEEHFRRRVTLWVNAVAEFRRRVR
jgi:serine/threonine-protein kinase